jgi:hypothetical protein
MSRPVNVQHKARNGKHYFKATVSATPEQRKLLVDGLDLLTAFMAGINKKSLPPQLRNDLGEHARWIKAGIRHADGLKVSTGQLRNDLPTEDLLIRRSRDSATSVDELIAQCTEALRKNHQIPKSIAS